jgi:hypothetical protein
MLSIVRMHWPHRLLVLVFPHRKFPRFRSRHDRRLGRLGARRERSTLPPHRSAAPRKWQRLSENSGSAAKECRAQLVRRPTCPEFKRAPPRPQSLRINSRMAALRHRGTQLPDRIKPRTEAIALACTPPSGDRPPRSVAPEISTAPYRKNPDSNRLTLSRRGRAPPMMPNR